MLVKQPQKKPHEDDPRGKDETHDVPTPPQEPQREAETQKTARTEIDAREKFERRKRAEKHSRETYRRPPKPADAGGSGAAPFQNFPYVFVLFHNYDFFYAVWAAFALLPFLWAIFQRGGIQTRFQDKKISRNLYIAADLFV